MGAGAGAAPTLLVLAQETALTKVRQTMRRAKTFMR